MKWWYVPLAIIALPYAYLLLKCAGAGWLAGMTTYARWRDGRRQHR